MYKDILIWTAWYAHDKLNNLTLYNLPVHLFKPFENLIYGSEVTGVNSSQFEVFSLPSLSAPIIVSWPGAIFAADRH